MKDEQLDRLRNAPDSEIAELLREFTPLVNLTAEDYEMQLSYKGCETEKVCFEITFEELMEEVRRRLKPSDFVKVKALEWECDNYGSLGVQHLAQSLGYSYYVWATPSGYAQEIWRGSGNGDGGEYEMVLHINHPSESEAKAACQAHYDSMIYELLEVR